LVADVMPSLDSSLDDIAHAFGLALQREGWVVGTAESCTGGLVACALTERSGSSAWFDRGVVTYTNTAKQEMLGVSSNVLAEHGAVSEPCARAMALGLLAQLGGQSGSASNAMALSVTGIAGPTGAVPGKPVGTVCFAWALYSQSGGQRVESRTQWFAGSRDEVRLQAAHFSVDIAHSLLGNATHDGAGLVA
jgi:nicotinamide-nucleotide amidase